MVNNISVFQYEKVFESVCSGLGSEPNQKIIMKCYNETKEHMNMSILQRIEKCLSETCKRHPVYSDFISAAYQSGYMIAKNKIEYEPCKLNLCDGTGYLSIQKKVHNKWRDYICRCSCHVGKNRPYQLGANKKSIYRTWDVIRKENNTRLYHQT